MFTNYQCLPTTNINIYIIINKSVINNKPGQIFTQRTVNSACWQVDQEVANQKKSGSFSAPLSWMCESPFPHMISEPAGRRRLTWSTATRPRRPLKTSSNPPITARLEGARKTNLMMGSLLPPFAALNEADIFFGSLGETWIRTFDARACRSAPP